MITTPSGGQVLLDQGYYEITGLAWSGRGKVRRVDVSVDGGRNWRTARLQEPVLTKALTRFRLDWNWDGAPALLQSRAIDETGYVQPTHSAAARGARHALDLSQQRDPDLARATRRRGEECPGRLARCCALALMRGDAVRRRAAGAALRLRPRADAAGDRRLGHRRAARRARAQSGQGHCRAGPGDLRRAVRELPRHVRREQRYMPIAGGVRKDDLTTGRASMLLQSDGLRTLGTQAQLRDDAVGLHLSRDAVGQSADR